MCVVLFFQVAMSQMSGGGMLHAAISSDRRQVQQQQGFQMPDHG